MKSCRIIAVVALLLAAGCERSALLPTEPERFVSTEATTGSAPARRRAAASTVVCANPAPLIRHSNPTGEFMVLFKNVAEHECAATIESLERKYGFNVTYPWCAQPTGFVAALTPAQVSALLCDRRIAFVEEDFYFWPALQPPLESDVAPGSEPRRMSAERRGVPPAGSR